jgi:hypothetical protein
VLEQEQEVTPEEPKVAKKNPFAADNVMKAFENVAGRANGRIKATTLEPTHNYVRFDPENLSQIMHLQLLGHDLWNEPLDQPVAQPAHPPGVADSLSQFYTLIPTNYSIAPVPNAVISQVILFDEHAGDEQDIMPDPWIPQPDNCPDPFNPNCPCLEGPCARTATDVREDLVKKTTLQLLQAGVNLAELYNEMMKLAGNPEDTIEYHTRGRTKNHRPSGCITVTDNLPSGTVNVPVKNIEVKMRRWFKLNRVSTNDAGCFTATTEFRRKARVILVFRNNSAVVRGINGTAKLWQYIFPLKRDIGVFDRHALTNIRHNIDYVSSPVPIGAHHFAAAHCLNTLDDTRQYSTNHGFGVFAPGATGPISIWLTSERTAPELPAPMLRLIARSRVDIGQVIIDELISNIIKYAVIAKKTGPKGFLVSLAKGVAKDLGKKEIERQVTPDMIVGLTDSWQTLHSPELNFRFFREFANVMHYYRAGNVFWRALNGAVLINQGYGNKNSPHSGYIAVAQSWAYFIGLTSNATRYNSSAFTFANDQRARLEFQTPTNDTPVSLLRTTTAGWIPFGMLHDLVDIGEPLATGVIDNVSNYTIGGIFRGYNFEAINIQSLRQQILNQNNNSQVVQVHELTTSYGW